MSKRHSVKIDLPKLKSTNHHYELLEKRLQNVPDNAKVTITQSLKGEITFVVITNKGKPSDGVIDTLVSGKPEKKVNSLDALSFKIPRIRSSLLVEAYYSKKDSGDTKLKFYWDKK